MVLFAIVGQLGVGKTLALTYLAWHNWMNKKRAVYANYNLYGIPFVKVNTLPNLDTMSSGFFAADELWVWLDSWTRKDEKKRMTSSILLKSRKRDLTIAYTTQSMMQVTPRIRNITDFIAMPVMSADESACKIIIMQGGSARPTPINTPPLYFNTKFFYAMYNTREEIEALSDEKGCYTEMFNEVRNNSAFINDYLIKQKVVPQQKILKYCEMIQNALNPDNIRSEKQRKEKDEELIPY